MKNGTMTAIFLALLTVFFPTFSYAALEIVPVNPTNDYYECYPSSEKILLVSKCIDESTVENAYCYIDICHFWSPSGDFYSTKQTSDCYFVVENTTQQFACSSPVQGFEQQNKQIDFSTSSSSKDNAWSADVRYGE